MTKKNFLLGKGERLTEDIYIKPGGAPKEPPYTFMEARERLSPMLIKTVALVDNLPSDACPRDQAVISLTLNPEYIAKSYFPSKLIRSLDIEVVGSRPKKLTPEKRSLGREVEKAVTTELFVQGSRNSIRSWSKNLPNWEESYRGADDLVSLEEISALVPLNKIKGQLPEEGDLPMEIVLHANEIEAKTHVLREFETYLKKRDLPSEFGARFFAKGLCFLQINAPANRVTEIALFSMVRALRPMPELRLLKPTIRTSSFPVNVPQLPEELPISNDIRVAIFDGGIPEAHPLRDWVSLYEFPGMSQATEDFLSHGVGVTSAVLFGHINPHEPILPRPYSYIDHYRVLDKDPDQDPYELYEVLERIDEVLSREEYDFINLSLGPRLPIEDDDIHAWTAVLDDRLSHTSTLAAISVGNDGEGNSELGLDRIQVPADCVNALAVGACDTPEDDWRRAPYSSVGPGRSPGLMKPDLVDFGGVVERPFLVLAPEIKPSLSSTWGTSFATPSVVRLAAGIRAHFGAPINHLAIRTLLIHTAEESGYNNKEVGWGRAARDLSDIVLCDDDSVRVVYQGEISPAKYIRAAIPVPTGEIQGMVSIKATLCYKTPTDPHHPGNYTRAGLQVTFRPNDGKFTRNNQVHPNSESFFGARRIGLTEDELRHDVWKWENCLHATKRKQGRSLSNPCFDIHYNARLEGQNYAPNEKLPYALVVTVQARRIPDLYDQIVRKYATLIEPLRPIIELPIQT